MIVVLAVAVAAFIGAAAGAFFEVRLRSLLWLAPVAVLAVAAALFAGPVLRDNAAAPGWARDVADPWSLAQMFAGGLTAAAVAGLMLRLVREQRSGRVWLPSMSEGGAGPRARRVGDARPRPVAPARLRDRMEAVQERAPSVLARERRTMDALPVFEVEAEAPARRLPMPEPPRPPSAPEPEPGAEKRVHPRRRALLAGQILTAEGASAACTIQNLSVSGARVRLAAPQLLPREVCLIDISNGLAHDAIVSWSRGASLGLHFERSLDLKQPQGGRAEALHHHWASLASR
jgi:hypothetical protein